MEDFWLKILFFTFVILWSAFVIGLFLVLVRLSFLWFEGGFNMFGIYFAPAI